MKIYLDTCCYNRPYDDQSQERVYLESEAILSILKRAERGSFKILGSEAIKVELDSIKNEYKKEKTKNLYQIIDEEITYTKEIKQRAKEIMELSNIRLLDSLHIASAEASNAQVLLTTDDKLKKMASNLDLKVKLKNPLNFVLEVL